MDWVFEFSFFVLVNEKVNAKNLVTGKLVNIGWFWLLKNSYSPLVNEKHDVSLVFW